jgi:hypothetical protein
VADDSTVPRAGLCITCGRDLGAEPHLIVSAPDGEHLGCRDWTRYPWPRPFEQLERRLAGRVRAIQRALELTAELGSLLVERRRRWPLDAAETVAEVERRSRELRSVLERAGLRV